MKNIDEHFADFESEAFGFGYGTGEQYTLPALVNFMRAIPPEENYNYQMLEQEFTPLVAWLFINILCREGIITYGTSPRFGFLSSSGQRLREYILSKSIVHLQEVIDLCTDDYTPCYKGVCNCGPGGYDKKRVCPNPFWEEKNFSGIKIISDANLSSGEVVVKLP